MPFPSQVSLMIIFDFIFLNISLNNLMKKIALRIVEEAERELHDVTDILQRQSKSLACSSFFFP
jgi:hypothetical protein